MTSITRGAAASCVGTQGEAYSLFHAKQDRRLAKGLVRLIKKSGQKAPQELKDIADLDALVLVNGAMAQNGLFHALRSGLKHVDVHLIGDAVAPRRINDAIFEAELVARKI